MGEIIEFPDAKKARERIGALRSELEKLFSERDELICIICENIEMQYMLLFGDLEYKLYKAYCKYLRLRRKKEMIQAKKNRKEPIRMKEIEAELDEEFRAYQTKLNEKMADINRALERSEGRLLSEEDTAKLKKAYREIMKSLHPDLRPSVTEEEKKLFYHATECYKNGDLATMEMILSIIGGKAQDDLLSDVLSMEKEIERLETLTKSVREEIDRVKKRPPYTWKIYVEDEKKKSAKLRELREDLRSYEDAIRTQEESVADLLREKK